LPVRDTAHFTLTRVGSSGATRPLVRSCAGRASRPQLWAPNALPLIACEQAWRDWHALAPLRAAKHKQPFCYHHIDGVVTVARLVSEPGIDISLRLDCLNPFWRALRPDSSQARSRWTLKSFLTA